MLILLKIDLYSIPKTIYSPSFTKATQLKNLLNRKVEYPPLNSPKMLEYSFINLWILYLRWLFHQFLLNRIVQYWNSPKLWVLSKYINSATFMKATPNCS